MNRVNLTLEAHDILANIIVYNWFTGDISALYAFSNGYTIEREKDRNKVRTILKKHGYRCKIYGGVIREVIKA